ncbi:MAG TPA: MFS transporter [Syntrophorhabdaceae bacterium]|nr:MFS transporter [Syntrophorhabdaceae bacterium]
MRHYSEVKGKALAFLSLLWCVWFFNVSGRLIYTPILPMIEDEFMLTHFRATSIFLSQSIGYALGVILSGFYAGRIGFKKTIVISLGVMACTSFLIPFTKIFSLFYPILFVVGFFAGIYVPAIMPLIREHFGEKNLGRVISIYDSAASVAIFSIPLFAFFLLRFLQWREIFYVVGIALLSICVFFAFAGEELKANQPHKAVLKELISRKPLWVLMVMLSLAMGANMGIYNILPLFLTKELSLGIGHANSLLGISRLGGIGVAILCGFLIDRFDLGKIMFTLMIVSGILTIFLGTASTARIGILLLFQAIFITAIIPIGFVCIARLFNRETMSMAVGIIMPLGTLFGSGLIPYFLGLSGDLLSFRFGIVTLGILLTLTSWFALSLKNPEAST